MNYECAVFSAPKMYSAMETSENNIKMAKGVDKYVAKYHSRREQYKHTSCINRQGMDVLRSDRQDIYGQRLSHVSLSTFDSKRWIAENGVDTLSYGHKDVQLLRIPSTTEGGVITVSRVQSGVLSGPRSGP